MTAVGNMYRHVVALGNELGWLRTRQGSGSEWNDLKMSGRT